MGEYIGARIQFGGRLRRQHVPELIELINDADLHVDFDGEEPSEENLGEVFGDWEINYGNLDELEAFGQQHGLDYEYWHAEGPEWDAATVRYVDGEYDEILAGNSGPAILVSELKRDGGAKTMQRIAWFERPLKPLEIVP